MASCHVCGNHPMAEASGDRKLAIATWVCRDCKHCLERDLKRELDARELRRLYRLDK